MASTRRKKSPELAEKRFSQTTFEKINNKATVLNSFANKQNSFANKQPILKD
jgi:hypothetical protein